MTAKLHAVKLISRVALGLVWFYEGLVPKILFLRADEINLVQASIWSGEPPSSLYNFSEPRRCSSASG
jgi:DoxX-like family